MWAGQLPHAIMNFRNVLRQNTSNSVRVTHAVSDQAHVRRADAQVVCHAGIQPKVQFVNSKKIVLTALALGFLGIVGIGTHDPPPAAVVRNTSSQV